MKSYCVKTDENKPNVFKDLNNMLKLKMAEMQ